METAAALLLAVTAVAETQTVDLPEGILAAEALVVPLEAVCEAAEAEAAAVPQGVVPEEAEAIDLTSQLLILRVYNETCFDFHTDWLMFNRHSANHSGCVGV